MGYDGDADELVAALVDCHWLDRHEVYRLVVHDWHDHAPNYLRGNLARHGRPFVTQLAVQLAKQAAKESTKQAAKQPTTCTVPPNLTKPDPTQPQIEEKEEEANLIQKTAGYGIPHAADLVRAAIEGGTSISQLRDVLDYYENDRHLGPGALARRLEWAHPALEASQGWVTPDKKPPPTNRNTKYVDKRVSFVRKRRAEGKTTEEINEELRKLSLEPIANPDADDVD